MSLKISSMVFSMDYSFWLFILVFEYIIKKYSFLTSCEIDINNWYIINWIQQMKSLSSECSLAIRENFRKQIRRKQIDDLFAIKRKLLADYIQQQERKQKIGCANLIELFQAIKQETNLTASLSNLGNYLYSSDCLTKNQQLYGRKKTHQICLQITQYIFQKILPRLNLQSEQCEEDRRKCLTIVSNIMADSHAPHSQLIPIISEGINTNYPNISETNNEQVAELGWILGNIFCHKIDLSFESQLEKPIQQLLTLTQEIILVQNLEMMSMIYKSLKRFYDFVDEYFNPKHDADALIEHFKVHRLILLENTVNYNISIEYGTALLSIISFLESNIQYFDSFPEKLNEDVCLKCFKILSCTSSDKIMSSTLRLIKKLSGKRDIVVLIVKDYFDTIQNCLMYQGVTIKMEVLRLLIYLCIDQEITTFMVQKKQLQVIICQLLKSVRDTETLVQLIFLTKAIINQTERKCGMNAYAVIQEHLSHKIGAVGESATQIIKEIQENYHYFN